MDNEQQSSTDVHTLGSFFASQVEEISDGNIVPPRTAPQPEKDAMTSPQTVTRLPVVQSRHKSLVPRHDMEDQSFILVQQDPRSVSTVLNKASKADHSIDSEETLKFDGDNQTATTGVQTSLPSMAARKRRGQRSPHEVLPRGSLIREPLPS